MRLYPIVLTILAFSFTQQVFANHPSSSSISDSTVLSSSGADDLNSKPCEAIANACKSAGFARKGDHDKAFWHDCMKPVLLDKSVAGVTIDAKVVAACRTFKINKMQKELQEFQAHAASAK